jgi:hypothetical protein
MESNLDLASNGEVSTSFEEVLDKNNSRVTNPSEILNIQIGDKDDINEHETYSITTSLNPC